MGVPQREREREKGVERRERERERTQCQTSLEGFLQYSGKLFSFSSHRANSLL